MSIHEWMVGGGGLLFLILTVIQITPIKVNPWSQIARGIGKALNGDVLEKMEENNANEARYRILRFDDEIRHEVFHTEEHFNQIMDDIDTYEDYCDTHPKYPNNKAVYAIEKIKHTYKKCRDENLFL